MDSSYELVMQAIYDNNIQLIYCMNRGINVNKICSNGMTLIGAAAQTGNLTVLKSLIDYHNCVSVELDIRNENKCTNPLYLQLDSEPQKRSNVGYFVVCRDIEEAEFGDGPTPDGMEALEWDMEVNSAEEESAEDGEVNLYRWYANILNRTSIILESPEYDIGRLDRHGQSVLHYAINSGNIEMVEFLINTFNKDLHVNLSDGCGFTPLHMASANGDLEMVRWLLRKGASINSLGGRLRQTPLHVATRANHVAVMKLLIETGADVNIVDVDERSALTSAAKNGVAEGVRMLVKAGARVNHEEMEGVTALQYGVWTDVAEVVKILVENGARIVQSHNLLHIAVSNNNFDCVRALVKGGALVNFRDDRGITPLMFACSRKHIDMARFLISLGADVNTTSHIDGKTALHVCVQDVREAKSVNALIELLIEHGADMNATSYQGTVLFYSIIVENRCASLALVRHGADVHLRDERAYVDNLSLAKRHGNLELVKMLVFGGFRIREIEEESIEPEGDL
ncbi:putative ankyrin repeat protein RF_0381 isoform X2 [Aethina tumida]|uniref:putative ankyrin repeat protein RF_0381 isoform X2 n=1 Tax=Aethina tumida TaxID=116153 RepID=UPI0021475673|nr:putative ankyrin repeat protein RF_0381 isoform X2 [Aethina tumida]